MQVRRRRFLVYLDFDPFRAPRYYRQFALSLATALSYIFSKFNPLNTDTPLIRTLSMTPLVSVLTGFDCKRPFFVTERYVGHDRT